MLRLEVELKHISVICSEMTCALFAHSAPSAISQDYIEGEGKANQFCHNLFSALNLRKLQYLAYLDAIMMTVTFIQENSRKGMK